MTTPTPTDLRTLVAVEQADRDAAAALKFITRQRTADAAAADRMARGEEDESYFVQAFARHRQSALDAQAAEIGRLREEVEQSQAAALTTMYLMIDGFVHHMDFDANQRLKMRDRARADFAAAIVGNAMAAATLDRQP